MQNWLEGFEYRVRVDAGNIAPGCPGCSVGGLATVSYHALRAVRPEPVEALRYE